MHPMHPMHPMPIDTHLFSSQSPIPKKKTLLSISQSSAVGEIAGLGAEKFLLVRGIRLLRLVRALRHGAIAGGFFGVLWGSLGSTGPGCSSTSRSCGASWQVLLHLCRQPICCKCAFAMATWVLACRACQNMSPLARQYGFCPTNLVHPKGNQVLHPFAAPRILQSLDLQSFLKED